MIWLLASIAYVALHALLYFGILRTIPTFTSERGVFLYHVISMAAFTVVTLGCLVLLPVGGITFAFAVGTIMLHGVYSLSFLELWSLTEGGYSLQIMRAIGDSEAAGHPIDLSELEQIGRGKQGSRTGSLEAFGWITRADGTLSLTPRGRIVSGLLYGLRSLVSVTPAK
jgi:hypothetical protein